MASSDPIHSSLKLSRSLLPWGVRAEYRVEAALSPSAFVQLVCGAAELIPEQALDGKPLRDLKGREPGSLGEAALSGDELFFASGTIYTGTHSTHPQGMRALVGEPFYLRITSKFIEFDGPAHIVYSPAIVLGEDVPSLLPAAEYVREIGRLVPLALDRVRLGVELFSGSFAGSMFGFSPAVTESLYLELTPGAAKLSIDAALKRSADLPLSREGYFERADRVFQAACGFSMIKDFREKQAAS